MSENLTASQRTKIKFVSSLIGSISSVIVCCPLDLVKVRYQVSVRKNYSFILISIIKKTKTIIQLLKLLKTLIIKKE